MFKKFFFPVIYLATAVVFSACDSESGSDDELQTTASGLEYRIHEDKDGKNITPGDYLTINLKIFTSSDSIITDTYEHGTPFQFQLSESMYPGSFEEGLEHLSEGDSATFNVDVDTIFARTGQQIPDYIEPGTKLRYIVKVVKVQTEEEFNRAMIQEQEDQIKLDQELIDKHVAEKGYDAEKQPSGVTYVQKQEGSGKTAAAGDMVSVHYVGTLLDGSKFDSSRDRDEPIEFPLGQGQVIPGWDQGLVGMQEGERGILIIPSGMAYGKSGSQGVIPQNAVLVFDVEMIKVTKGEATQQQGLQ